MESFIKNVIQTVNYNNHNCQLTIYSTIVVIYVYIIYANKYAQFLHSTIINIVTVKSRNKNIYWHKTKIQYLTANFIFGRIFSVFSIIVLIFPQFLISFFWYFLVFFAHHIRRINYDTLNILLSAFPFFLLLYVITRNVFDWFLWS